jgi:hypothetical protein
MGPISNGTTYKYLLVIKWYFKSLSQINNAPVLTVLTINTPIQTEPSFNSKNIEVLGQEYCQRTACKNSYKNVILQLLECV